MNNPETLATLGTRHPKEKLNTTPKSKLKGLATQTLPKKQKNKNGR